MILKEFLPQPAFREFVQWYRIVHFEFDKFIKIPFKVYSPKPGECLYFILQDSLMLELNNSATVVGTPRLQGWCPRRPAQNVKVVTKNVENNLTKMK